MRHTFMYLPIEDDMEGFLSIFEDIDMARPKNYEAHAKRLDALLKKATDSNKKLKVDRKSVV